MIRFYKLPIIIEAENPNEALYFIEAIQNRYSSTLDVWVDGDPVELTKEEIMEFFDYDEEMYKELIMNKEEMLNSTIGGRIKEADRR